MASTLDVVIEEYKALRAEMVTTVDRQYSLINWMISAVAVLFAATINAWDKLQKTPAVAATVFLFIVPLIVTLFAVAWFNVVSKMATLGWYLHLIEEKVGAYFTDDEIRESFHLAPGAAIDRFAYLMGWEHRLWRSSSQVLIDATVRTVRLALALAYVLCLAGGAAILAVLTSAEIAGVAVSAIVITASCVWLAAWVALAFHLRSLGKVEAHPKLPSGSRRGYRSPTNTASTSRENAQS